MTDQEAILRRVAAAVFPDGEFTLCASDFGDIGWIRRKRPDGRQFDMAMELNRIVGADEQALAQQIRDAWQRVLSKPVLH